jgi:hypothetical protein
MTMRNSKIVVRFNGGRRFMPLSIPGFDECALIH